MHVLYATRPNLIPSKTQSPKYHPILRRGSLTTPRVNQGTLITTGLGRTITLDLYRELTVGLMGPKMATLAPKHHLADPYFYPE